jgi:GxxExxY protein
MQDNYKYSDITEKIIACALKVHKFFGLGFKEEIYERSLLIEMKKIGLKCVSQKTVDIYYLDQRVGQCRLDILVDEKVLLELKALSGIDEECTNRILNYMKVFNIEVGLLLNFGCRSLQIKRFVN